MSRLAVACPPISSSRRCRTALASEALSRSPPSSSPAHLGQDRAQIGDVGVGGVARGPAGRQALEGGAGLQDLDRLGDADQAHPGAAMGLELDEPLVLEPGQRRAHG